MYTFRHLLHDIKSDRIGRVIALHFGRWLNNSCADVYQHIMLAIPAKTYGVEMVLHTLGWFHDNGKITTEERDQFQAKLELLLANKGIQALELRPYYQAHCA